MTLNSGQFRYLATSSGQTSFSLANGRVAGSSLTSAQKIIHLGNASGLDLTFFGSGSDNTTFDYRIWLAMLTSTEAPKDTPTELELCYFGYGSCTLSTLVGATGGSLVTSSERMVDTLTFTAADTAATPKGVGGTLLDGYGITEPIPLSPADNTTCARLIVPLLSRICNGIVIEFDLTGATGANACYSLTG